MKDRALPMLTSALILAGYAMLPAQSVPSQFQMDVPFEFLIDGTRMPAGTYWIQSSDGRHVVISNTARPIRVSCVTLPINRPRLMASGHLVFRDENGSRSLQQVWWPKNGSGRMLVFENPAGKSQKSPSL